MTDTDMIDRALRERAGRWAATEPPPPPLRPMLDQAFGAAVPARRRPVRGRRVWLSVAAGVLAVVAVVALVSVLRPADGPGPTAQVPASWTPDNPGALTAAEYALALRVAHRQAEGSAGRPGANGWPATLTSVTALALAGTAAESYVLNPSGFAEPQLPGRVLVIRLIGSFPHTGVLPPPCGGSPDRCAHLAVTEMTRVVDAQSGKVLANDVSTTTAPAPLPHGTVLYRR
jgi:hypothetical protein